MAVTLAAGMTDVRTQIGELDPYNWTDETLINWLNQAARNMCSAAQNLTSFDTPGVLAGSQEAYLDYELDRVKVISWFMGQVYPLEYKPYKRLQTGAYSGAQPLWYYIKQDTKQLSGQTNSSNIVGQEQAPNLPLGSNFGTAIGLWPIPQISGNLYAWYSYWHPPMQNELDPCAVEPPFFEAWTAYAKYKAYESDEDYVTADRFQKIYLNGLKEYRIYGSKQKTASPARWGVDLPPWRQSASSSVILVDQDPTMSGPYGG
jgi:hypothetical protein